MKYKILKHKVNNTFGRINPKTDKIYEHKLPYLFNVDTNIEEFSSYEKISEYDLMLIEVLTIKD